MPSSSTSSTTPTSAPATELGGTWDDYRPPEGYFDEVITGAGEIRPHWREIWEHLSALGSEGLQERDRVMQSLIRENGITYNVYSEPADPQRLWTRDLLPLVAPEAEWQQIADAMRQRVTLLNLLAQDFYGPQRLIQEGHYPPGLVLGNPAFLRPCAGMLPRHRNWIHLFAADLARSPDGNWWVLSDRLEAASGMGYTLENRVLSGKVLPEILRKARVERLQPFISQFCESVAELAPRGKDDPNVVLLTPGPMNETYFEQSYLSRNLGYPLVEGADLTVRDHKVYLKTIEGLEQVDVILRRLDSPWCDPLELRSDSLLGVPGLLNAVREEHVIIANALGAGVLETPALPAFLPHLCRTLLGEDLKLPSVATWWCGQGRERDYVLEHLAELVIKPVFREMQMPVFFGPQLSSAELEDVRGRIRKNPTMWCAQEQVARATAPVFQNDAITPRHFLSRVFLVPNRDNWNIMPGGLARISPESEGVSVSMQHGGLSKDIWIVSDRDHRTTKPARGHSTAHSITWRPQLPSRSADNLFWLGRYAERAEHLARIIRLLLDASTELESRSPLDDLKPLLRFLVPAEDYPALGLENGIDAPENAGQANDGTSRLINDLIWNREIPGSLADSIGQVQGAASSLRERLSEDASQIIAKLALPAAPKDLRHLEDRAFIVIDETLDRLGSLTGAIYDNMIRGDGWRFLDIGRRIERAINLAVLLRTSLVSNPADLEIILTRIIAVLDCTISYRRQNLNVLSMERVLDMAVWAGDNPRSIQFQIDALNRHIGELRKIRSEGRRHPLQQRIVRAGSRLGLADLNELCAPDAGNRFGALERFLTAIHSDVLAVSDTLSETFFAITQERENVTTQPFFTTPDEL